MNGILGACGISGNNRTATHNSFYSSFSVFHAVVLRWGDQQWWPRPIAMFGEGNLNKEIDHYDTINTDNERYLVHKLLPR